MHHSVIEARAVRNRENDRRRYNVRKRQAQSFVIACGLNPAFTPSPFGQKRSIRRNWSREERRMRRFLINVSRLF